MTSSTGSPAPINGARCGESLQARLRDTVAARDADDGRRAGLPRHSIAKIRELRAQVEALAQEEAVSQFVEDSVRSSLAQAGHRAPVADDEEDSGF